MVNGVVGDLEREVEMGKERVGVLEAYAGDIEEQVRGQVDHINQLHDAMDRNRPNQPHQHT